MSTAADKNRQALAALLDSAELASTLLELRIAVVTPPGESPASAALLTEVLADTLGRLWPNMDFDGELAAVGLQTAQRAATSGNAPTSGLRVAWAPPYDVIVSVGCPPPAGQGLTITVGANGWEVGFGDHAACGDSDNPVGPAFAAGLAAAQVFATCFREQLGDSVRSLDHWHADVRDLFGAPALHDGPLDIGICHLFGIGAVTHGFAWLLERWPSEVMGAIDLVDRDTYGAGNGQRYAFMPPGVAGAGKAELVARRLRTHPGLQVNDHHVDLNTFCALRGYHKVLGRVVTGLDSEESRRQAALKLPPRTINMWTGGSYIGAGQYVPGPSRGCLACAYPEPVHTPLDETAVFAGATRLAPAIVRELLNTARPLTEQEAHVVAVARNVPIERIVGEPIRSIFPVLCATGSVAPEVGKAAVDVPLAFSSLLASVAGFVMFLRDVQAQDWVSEAWTQHVFKRPAASMMHTQGVHPQCVRCSSAALLDLAETAG